MHFLLLSAGLTTDIVLVVILCVAAIFGWFSGFLRSMLFFFSLIFAVVFAYYLCDVTLNFLEQKFEVVTKLAAWYEEKLFSASYLSVPVSEEGLETAFAQLHFPAFLSDLIKERSFEGESSLTVGFVLSVFVARMTLQAILFFVLIALFLVLLFVLGRIFSALIAKIPVIGTLNRVLGAIFGLILALFAIYFVFFLAYLIFGEKAGAFFAQSSVGNFFYSHNLFGVLLQKYVLEGVKQFFSGLLPSPTDASLFCLLTPLPR
mgnify:CR=1 FL=1